MSKQNTKIVFLDRDGVINECPGEGNYVTSASQFKLHAFARPAIEKLKKAGFKVFVISNQACVAKQMISESEATAIMQQMLDQIEQGGKHLIDGVYYCKHDGKESCFFRKPNPGMIFEAYKSIGVTKDSLTYQPWFVGDTIRDIETAHNAGVRGLLVFTGRERPEHNAQWSHKPHAAASTLAEAVEHILQSGEH